jgi:hypothetical protein
MWQTSTDVEGNKNIERKSLDGNQWRGSWESDSHERETLHEKKQIHTKIDLVTCVFSGSDFSVSFALSIHPKGRIGSLFISLVMQRILISCELVLFSSISFCYSGKQTLGSVFSWMITRYLDVLIEIEMMQLCSTPSSISQMMPISSSQWNKNTQTDKLSSLCFMFASKITLYIFSFTTTSSHSIRTVSLVRFLSLSLSLSLSWCVIMSCVWFPFPSHLFFHWISPSLFFCLSFVNWNEIKTFGDEFSSHLPH